MTHPTIDHDHDSLLEESWLAAPQQGSRSRIVLVALLAATVCFLGGAVAQKHYGTEATASSGATGAAGFPSNAPNGFPTGGFPGTDQQGAEATSGDTGNTQSVIGTVVKVANGTWVVEDLGGTRHRVAIAEDTTIIRERHLAANQVEAGDRVQISGTSAHNTLRATDVTLR
jgi:hypothetical protein